MKRYNMQGDYGAEVDASESPDGEWVKFEDVDSRFVVLAYFGDGISNVWVIEASDEAMAKGAVKLLAGFSDTHGLRAYRVNDLPFGWSYWS